MKLSSWAFDKHSSDNQNKVKSCVRKTRGDEDLKQQDISQMLNKNAVVVRKGKEEKREACSVKTVRWEQRWRHLDVEDRLHAVKKTKCHPQQLFKQKGE